MLDADFSHFGEDIINGLKNGTYSIQESKNVLAIFVLTLLMQKDVLLGLLH